MMRALTLGIGVLILATPAEAQSTPDAVRAGYQLLYAGDATGAVRYFDNLLKQQPGDLSLRFGSLMARMGPIANDDSLSPAYERDLDALIGLADARYRRSRRDTEALRYMAAGHMLRAEYRFEYDKGMWGAARDAAKAKGYGDDYVKLHPEHADADFALGLYNYYVDLAPTLFKMVRFLLFLPAGNRAEGLKQLERAAAQGDLMAPMAQQALVAIYSEFEGRPADAVARAERLRQQYPDNDDFAMTAADVHAGPALEDHARAADVYAAIVRRRLSDSSRDAVAMRYRATIALANARAEQWRTDEAVAELTRVVDANVRTPAWVLPLSLLRRANFRALLNDAGALDDLRRVQAEFKGSVWSKNAAGLQKWVEARRTIGEAAEVAELVTGNRLAGERKWAEARRAYEAVLARLPASSSAQYRLACIRFMTEPPEQSMAAFTALASSRQAYTTVRGMALLHVARIHDLGGRRAMALAVYRKVDDDFEGERAADLARIGLITPYKRPVTEGRGGMQ
jgi:hypothetical protein